MLQVPILCLRHGDSIHSAYESTVVNELLEVRVFRAGCRPELMACLGAVMADWQPPLLRLCTLDQVPTRRWHAPRAAMGGAMIV
jgi:hypothetical protein